MRLLLGGMIVSLGLWILPVQALTNTQVGAMVEALRLAAETCSLGAMRHDCKVSKRAPKTAKQNDRLYSEWQITPGIIPSWSKQCVGKELTPQQLETDSKTARDIVSCITRREFQKHYASTKNETTAVRRTACWWMTGNASACNSGLTATYAQKVLSLYQQQTAKKLTPQR